MGRGWVVTRRADGEGLGLRIEVELEPTGDMLSLDLVKKTSIFNRRYYVYQTP